MVQWLRVCTSTAGVAGSIPGQETKIPHATWCRKKKKKLNIILILPPHPTRPNPSTWHPECTAPIPSTTAVHPSYHLDTPPLQPH